MTTFNIILFFLLPCTTNAVIVSINLMQNYGDGFCLSLQSFMCFLCRHSLSLFCKSCHQHLYGGVNWYIEYTNYIWQETLECKVKIEVRLHISHVPSHCYSWCRWYLVNDSCCVSLALLELPKCVLSSVMVEFLCTHISIYLYIF